MVRARWSALLGGAELLHAAFSLESVADEVIFVAGPVLVTLLATEAYPASGIAVAAATCVAGTLLLAAQRATGPSGQPGDPVPGAGRRARGHLLPARGRSGQATTIGISHASRRRTTPATNHAGAPSVIRQVQTPAIQSL